MKVLLLIALLTGVLPAAAQDVKEKDGEMKTYYMVFLKRVHNRPVLDSAKAAEIQKAHINHLDRMAAEGKLCIAGPFMDDKEVRGICIYTTETMEEALTLANSDPAVKAGRLTIECRPWFGMKGSMLR